MSPSSARADLRAFLRTSARCRSRLTWLWNPLAKRSGGARSREGPLYLTMLPHVWVVDPECDGRNPHARLRPVASFARGRIDAGDLLPASVAALLILCGGRPNESCVGRRLRAFTVSIPFQNWESMSQELQPCDL